MINNQSLYVEGQRWQLSSSIANLVRMVIVGFASLLLLFLVGVASADAAVVTWDGGGGDNNWNTGLNWDTDTAPTASDVATFDGTSTKNATINVPIDVAGIDINTGYTGIITQAAAMTIGASGFYQSAGTFTGATQDIDLNANLYIDGGTFTATSGNFYIETAFFQNGSTFNHNNGTIIYTRSSNVDDIWQIAGGTTLYNLTINNSITSTSYGIEIGSNDLYIDNDLLFLTGHFQSDSSALYVGGDITFDPGFGTNRAITAMNGAGDQNIYGCVNSNLDFNTTLSINKPSGTAYLQCHLYAQKFYVPSGTFDANGYNVKTSTTTNSFSVSGGTFLGGTGTLTFQDDFKVTDTGTFTSTTGILYVGDNDIRLDATATFNHNNGTVVVNKGVTTTMNLGQTMTFYNLTTSTTMNMDAGERVKVANTLSLSGGTINGGTVEVQGDVTAGSGWVNGSTTTLEFTGTAAQNFSLYTGNEDYFDGNLTINKASETVTLGSDIILDATGQDLTITSGTLDASASNYDITVAGNWSNSGTFTPRSGAVIFVDAGGTSTIVGNTSFYDFTSTTASKRIDFTEGSTQTVSGTLTLTGGDGALIDLNSTNPGVRWNINVSGSSAVSYTDIQDSDASSGNQIDTNTVVSGSCNDSGNNVNWLFNTAPTVSSVTAVQSSAADGDVTVTFTVDDADDDNTVQAVLEYSDDGGVSWYDPTISTTGSETSATYGDPSVDNAQTYQVGQAGSYITTSSGANTVSTVWEATTDVASSTDISNAQIRVTAYDGIAAGSASTSANFVLDLVDPTGLIELFEVAAGDGSITLNWTAVTETNFDHYEIWYGANQSDVQNRNGAATEWDDTDDANLATVSTTTTTIVANPNSKYFKIWAVDTAGNSQTIMDAFITFGMGYVSTVNTPTNLTVTDYEEGVVKVSWTDPIGNFDLIQILRGLSPYPVNGTPLGLVSAGVGYYLDSDVQSGNVLIYQLKAKDGNTYSEVTDTVTFVVGSTLVVEEESNEGGTTEEEVIEDTELVEEEVVEDEEVCDEVDVIDEETVEEGVEAIAGEEEVVDEETVEEDVEAIAGEEEVAGEETVDGDNTADEGSASVGQSLDDLFGEAPTHWSEGYLNEIGEDDRVIEKSEEEETLREIFENIFQDPNSEINRGEMTELLLSVFTDYTVVESEVDTFVDVDEMYKRGYLIEFAADLGLIEGYPNGKFLPENTVSRSGALKMVTYFFGLDVTDELCGDDLLEYYGLEANPFTDVDLQAWYASYVLYAYANGVVHGYDDGTGRFGPSNHITYAEFLKIATLLADIENAVELSSELE